jgi:hypothetical protein
LPVLGLKLDFWQSSSCVPQRLLASSVRSFRSSTLGSNCDSGAMNWIMSWPWPAEISAAIRVVICAWSMWSTLTSTPVLLPQSLANLSNQASWLGTKWLHSRMLRPPESFFDGSSKVSAGAPPGAPVGPPGPASSSLAQPASMAPAASAPAVRRKSLLFVIGDSFARCSSMTVGRCDLDH